MLLNAMKRLPLPAFLHPLALLLIPIAGSGCNPVHYPFDRALDLCDIFSANFGAGKTALGNIRLTQFFQLGAGFMDQTERAGFRGREVGYWKEARKEWGAFVGYYSEYAREDLHGNRFFMENFPRGGKQEPMIPLHDNVLAWERNTDRAWSDIGFSFFLFGGLEMDLRVSEVADFIAGLLTFDPSRDDLAHFGKEDRAARLKDLPHESEVRGLKRPRPQESAEKTKEKK
jgi:hypothetical protein